MENIQLSLFGKMSPERSAATKERTSEPSLKNSSKSLSRQPLCLRFRRTDGPTQTVIAETDGALRTEFLTLNTGESPSAAVESTLSSTLEENAPEKYYLSEKATLGILRRSARCGKELPLMLEYALIQKTIEGEPFGQTVIENSRKILRSVREEVGAAEAKEWVRRTIVLVQQEEVLQPGVQCKGEEADRLQGEQSENMGRRARSCEETVPGDRCVCGLREARENGDTPHRRELLEQRSREFSEIMQKLSCKETQEAVAMYCLRTASESEESLLQALSTIQEREAGADRPIPYTLKIRSGCEGGGKGALIQEDKSATLATNNDQYLFQPVNMVLDDQGGQQITVRTDGKAPTLRAETHGNLPCVLESAGFTIQGFGDYKDGGIGSCLKARYYKDATDLVVESAGIDCRNFTEYPELYPTLQAKQNGGQSLNFSGAVRVQYIVRRLTPTECARLQGFPDDWGHPDHKEDFTDEEYRFWCDVVLTKSLVDGTVAYNEDGELYFVKRLKPYKPKTKAQMLTWYNKLHTDSAEYKMWGNGIALPPALYCMQGMTDALGREEEDE